LPSLEPEDSPPDRDLDLDRDPDLDPATELLLPDTLAALDDGQLVDTAQPSLSPLPPSLPHPPVPAGAPPPPPPTTSTRRSSTG
jgi:hypothetical protein